MENDKFQNLVLEHLANLTQEITELKQDNSVIKHEITELKQDNSVIKYDLTHIKESVIRIENDHGEKLKALFDAREVQIDVNERICETLNRIEGKVDRLTLKVSSHDSLLKKVK